MLTDEQFKKIQEAMKDTEFAKSVMETKTEEEIVSLLKDKKGITVSVDDIKDLNETVRKIPTEELNVAGGGIPKFVKDLWGKVPQAGAYGTYAAAAVAAATALAAVSVLGYKVYKKYCGKSGGEAAATSGDSSATQQVSAE